MGERVLCKHEVVGSIPSASTREGGRDEPCPSVTNDDPAHEISDERESRYPLRRVWDL